MTRPDMLKRGDLAPEFDAVDHTGRPISLADLRGSKVVLWFYPKADTPGWTLEGSGFRDLTDQFAAKNTKIIGVSVDTREENARFAEKFRFPFPLIGDAERKICMAYGACDSASDQYARRIAYVIDHNGRIDEAFDKVDARQFPHEVLAKVW